MSLRFGKRPIRWAPALLLSLLPVVPLSGGAFAGAVAPGAEAPGSLAADADTEAAIVGMMQRMSDGVARRDLDAIMDLFLPGADALLIGSKKGKVACGSDEIRALFRGIIGAKAATHLQWNTYTVQSSGELAWMFALADLIHEDDEGASRVPYRVTGLFIRRDGRWYWLQYHGSEPVGG